MNTEMVNDTASPMNDDSSHEQFLTFLLAGEEYGVCEGALVL